MNAKSAFLSSLYTEHKALRRELSVRAETEAGVHLWVAEVDDEDLSSKPPLEIVDVLMREVREADIYICILGPSRHGSPVPIHGRDTNVSYFEIEIFQAALLQKPITLFVTKDFNPDPRLAALLEILRFALPSDAFHTQLSEREIIANTLQLLGGARQQNRLWRMCRTVRNWLTHSLDVHRSARVGASLDEGLQFLGGEINRTGALPDKELVQSLLEKERLVTNEEQRLARLWLAVRELHAAPYDDERYAEYRDLWNAALGRWARAGSWYGLHAHLYLGVLAALKSQSRIRNMMRDRKQSSSISVSHPGGGLASAYYSIARRHPTLRRRRRNYYKALWHLERSIVEGQGDLSGLLAIRGSIYLRLGKPWRACTDYERVLYLREQAGLPEHQLGEALSELGYGYLFEGRLFKGKQYLEEGVRLLSRDKQSGFLVRAKKKLATAYAVTGHPLKARHELTDAQEIARRLGTFDQL